MGIIATILGIILPIITIIYFVHWYKSKDDKPELYIDKAHLDKTQDDYILYLKVVNNGKKTAKLVEVIANRLETEDGKSVSSFKSGNLDCKSTKEYRTTINRDADREFKLLIIYSNNTSEILTRENARNENKLPIKTNCIFTIVISAEDIKSKTQKIEVWYSGKCVKNDKKMRSKHFKNKVIEQPDTKKKSLWQLYEAYKPESTHEKIKIVVVVLMLSLMFVIGVNWYNSEQTIKELKRIAANWDLDTKQKDIIKKVLERSESAKIVVFSTDTNKVIRDSLIETFMLSGWTASPSLFYEGVEKIKVRFYFWYPETTKERPESINKLLEAFDKADLIDIEKEGEHYEVKPISTLDKAFGKNPKDISKFRGIIYDDEVFVDPDEKIKDILILVICSRPYQ